MSVTGAEARAFVEIAYRAVFRRVADPGGLETYAAALEAGLSPAALLATFAASDEFRENRHGRLDDYDAQHDPALAAFRPFANERLASELTSLVHLDVPVFERLHAEACARGHAPGMEYPADHLVFHKRRFAELLSAACRFTTGRARPRLLDVGSTQNLPWYKTLIPHAELIAADRPDGPVYAEADDRIGLDLNGGDPGPLLRRAPYDLIVFTEVLEHLSINPVVLLRQLIGALSRDGILYLTTPNFFRSENLKRIARRENPLPVYPVDNADRHHHTREYAMAELLGFVAEAGGRLEGWYFSDCWDDVPVPVEERGNLVVIAGPAGP